MPCDTTPAKGQTLQQRVSEVDKALARLEAAMNMGQVKVIIGGNGAVAFVGNWDRRKLSDVCAYRVLSVKGSFALRKAVATAERMAGRKVNPSAVASGLHSHDGGASWSRHWSRH